ncbi:MAG: hypothetical protein RL217_1276 [Pseudomonadota bacterium]|jgi:tRNA 2-thiouridine synthesizing protein E
MTTLALDKDGFLQDLNAWNEQVAQQLAQSEGIALSNAHFEVIYALRDFYTEFQLSPAMRPLTRYLKERLGAEKATSLYLLQLFPQSPAKLAAKIAGLPRPENCL